MSILIKNGKVVTASEISDADVFIDGEKINSIGIKLDVKADIVIDAAGKLIMPAIRPIRVMPSTAEACTYW